MTIHHLGNNWYVGRWGEGDRREQLSNIQKCVYLDADTGVFSYYTNNAWNTVTNNTGTDLLFATWQIERTLTNIGTSYTGIYPVLFDGLPLGLDTTGFTQLGIVVAWNKNGGTGRHDLRIVNANNEAEVLVNSESTDNGMVTGTRRHYGFPIPQTFKDFRGEIKLQAKSTVGSDDPIFYGLWLYLIR